MTNPRMGKIMKNIWFIDDKEYYNLKEAIECNYKDEVFRIIFDINKRGDL